MKSRPPFFSPLGEKIHLAGCDLMIDGSIAVTPYLDENYREGPYVMCFGEPTFVMSGSGTPFF
jgi:hypothetical protein